MLLDLVLYVILLWENMWSFVVLFCSCCSFGIMVNVVVVFVDSDCIVNLWHMVDE